MHLTNQLYTNDGWEIIEKEFDPDQIFNRGSIFLIGNGYYGYRGSFAEWGSDRYVACILSDTYDRADGKWSELCNVPNALYTRLFVDGEEVSVFSGSDTSCRRKLKLKDGTLSRSLEWSGNRGQKVSLRTERFASYHNLHLLPMRYSFRLNRAAEVKMLMGIDGRVWDLNGKHLQDYRLSQDGTRLVLESRTVEEGIRIVVVTDWQHNLTSVQRDTVISDDQNLQQLTFRLEAGEEVTFERMVSIFSSNDCQKPLQQALETNACALNTGYSTLKDKHQEVWEKKWEQSDIQIKGDLKAQALLRFNLYHNIIATPSHTDRLPIGARGLSCQAYQGAAFWDQELFNLPMYIYTQPEVARRILKYRYHTLDGARRKASRLGYRGAFYAWVSGKRGDELCPSYFFRDVLTGRRIHNHFNDWQIHVSPDIVYALWHYYQVTDDWQFVIDYGAEIVFEVARFLYSHAYYKPEKGRYELLRVIGPDEYHENVDNNAYTNYQAYFALQWAVDIYNRLKRENEERLQELRQDLSLDSKEVALWQRMADCLYLPLPEVESLLIEQFDGYFKLEDTTPEKLRERLLDPEEYWGWPNGVAVETQIIKQADVIQLFCEHDIFSPEIVEANFNYYYQRTEHGSSLSPSSYAIAACRAGDIERAYDLYLKSCTIDLANSNRQQSGGTFIGGIHTAACGAAWKIVVQGFAGLTVEENGLRLNPGLPAHWDSLEFNLLYRGNHLHFSYDQQQILISSSEDNKEELMFKLVDTEERVLPGQELSIPLS